MVPEKIARFLEERANVGFAGTRDADLVPHGHGVSGWRLEPDGETLTWFVPEEFLDHLLESLQDNGQVALTVEEFPSHETYQFKGRYVSHRRVEVEDLAIHERVRERFVKNLKPIFPEAPEAFLRAFITRPALVVSFAVREIFLQTPGPKAGTRLVPPVEG